MEAPSEGYSPGVVIIREHDAENAMKVVKWMIEHKQEHPDCGNYILGGNHSHHTNGLMMVHFKDRPDIARRFERLRFVVLRWPYPNLDFTQDVVNDLFAVRLCLMSRIFMFYSVT